MSSAGYASRLSAFDRKGVCGLPELFDTSRNLSIKLDKLVSWIQEAHQKVQTYGTGGVVVLTGAGISTSAGIPDFRGPRGIWTMEQQEKKKQQRKQATKITKSTTTTTNKRASSQMDDDSITENDDTNDVNEENQTKSQTDNRRKKRYQRSTSSLSTSSSVSAPSCLLQDWSHAKPTFTHYAITKLIQDEHHWFRFCVTQNVDGLHRRSGLSRRYHAVLHGCAFTERCDICHTEYFHDTDLGGMSFAPTGRLCTKLVVVRMRKSKQPNDVSVVPTPEDDHDDNDDDSEDHEEDGVVELKACGGNLRDTLLDWHDALPEEDFQRATHECEQADLAICLGTSLRIEPAGSLPTLARRFVIVNLQETPKDEQAALIIRARVDDVMKELLKRLGVECANQENEAPSIERIWTPPTTVPKQSTARDVSHIF